jgi:alpha-amylase/alpha-mannosidase (GH57 family)
VERYITIHGHFYQPPRENPWLEAIELQDSAYPYHDWNERIDAECYAPNSASRILDGEGRIAQIVNNYAAISYNFGPTLLAWMRDKSPETYRRALEADQESRRRFSGHGSALAQCYNHMIMPLANTRDKHTQVRWGLRDFEHRFGRFPEGMWLPEAAVDIETLGILAEHGIRFTILAPSQARRVRQGRRAWQDVGGGRIDPTMCYRLRLPSRRNIALFFYDGPISRAVAFERLLDSGERFAERLAGAFSDGRPWPQLVHIATDGETYGHHHPHGEMALSYALRYIEDRGLARITNYGEFLEKHPPNQEVQIYENTSWSCVHGVERWRSNCGCNSGGRPGWNQEWRLPLREALDWLRDTVAPYYEQAGSELFADPWAARDDYIEVILDRSPESRAAFFARHATRPIDGALEVRALKLLELQRHAMLMYTSCGWFFDELSGIETVQVIQYAGRVLQLARELGAPDPEPCFLERLERARSNIPEHRDGRVIYEKLVRPAMVDLYKVGAHYAISSIFDEDSKSGRIYSYSVECKDCRVLTAGKARLALGRAKIVSEITEEPADVAFAAAYLGDHNVSGGIRTFAGEEAYQATAQLVTEVFRRGELPEMVRVVDREFGPGTYSLALLFRDAQRRILRQIVEESLGDADSAYRSIYQNHVSLMRFLASLGIPAPKRLEVAAEATLNTDLRRAFEHDELDLGRITALVDEAQIAKVPFDAPTLEFALRKTLERMAERWAGEPRRLDLLEQMDAAVGMARLLPFEIVLWHVQNIFYNLMRTFYREYRALTGAGEEEAQAWVERFGALGAKLSVRVE